MKLIIVLLMVLGLQTAQAQNCAGFSSNAEKVAFADKSSLAALKFLRAKYKTEGFRVEQVAFMNEAVTKGQDPSDCDLMTYQSDFEVIYRETNTRACIVHGQISGISRPDQEIQFQIVDDSVSAPDCRNL